MVYHNKTRVLNFGQKPRGFFNQMGFTLIEMMVALTIVGVVLAGVYSVYLNFNDHAVATEDVASMQQNVRVSIEQITRELRSAGYKFGAPVTGILGSVSATDITMDETNQTNAVTIQGDFDDNGKVEKVTYAIGCTETPCLHPWLMRKYDDGMGLGTPQFEPFAENITKVFFRFYDENGVDASVNSPATATPSQVKRVYVELTGRTDSPDPKVLTNGGYRFRTVSSDVVLRNFNIQNGDTTPPNCPTTNTATGTVGSCGQLTVTWTQPTERNDIAGYRIYYSTGTIDAIPPTPPTVGPDSDYGSKDVPCSPACPTTATMSATLTGLKSTSSTGTPINYNIIVESYDAFGNTSRCFPGSATDPKPAVSASPDAGFAPKAPTGLNAPLTEMSVSQVGLHWSPVTTSVNNTPESSILGYRVYRGASPSFTPVDPDVNGLGGNRVADENTVTVTSFLDKTVVACQVYFYKVKAVNTCGLVSAASNHLKATPPDNKRAPVAPVISQLVAGDDTSTLILDWKVPKPVDLNLASTPVLLKIYYKAKTSPTWLVHSAVDLTPPATTALPATGKVIFNGLASNTVYEVKLKTFDAAGECGDVTDSLVSSISTAACAPKIQWTTGTGQVRGGHFIFPGTTATGTKVDYLSGRTVVGSDPAAANDPDFLPNSKYITWVADPLDCTPDSSNFDRQGFDYSDPPTYTTVSLGAKVDFFINKPGDPSNTPADIAYGKGVASDTAPRSSDSYYHFPFYPTGAVDIDTGRFCSGDYDFRVRAVDGEQYTAENTISLTIMTGGVQVNSAFVTKTKISTGDDYHHIVELELMNTHPDKDLELTKMKLSWNNFQAYLKKVEHVLSPDVTLYEDLTAPMDMMSGSLVTLSNPPTLTKNGGKAIIRLTFTTVDGKVDATVDMRGKKFTSDIALRSYFETQDVLDSTFVCQSSVPNMTISQGPSIVANSTVLDQPSVNTIPSAVPLIGKGIAGGKAVGFLTAATDLTGNASYSVSSAKIHYAIGPFEGVTPPVRPSVPGGSSSYVNQSVLTLGTVTGGNGFWSGDIPALTNAGRVWYYLEVFDTDGNFDILPEVGAFTYAQCDSVPPTLLFQAPTLAGTTAPATIMQATDVTNPVTVFAASYTTGIKTVTFKVTGNLGVPLTVMTLQGSVIYTGNYVVPGYGDPAPDPLPSLSHTLTVTATDQCGNTTVVSRNYN